MTWSSLFFGDEKKEIIKILNFIGSSLENSTHDSPNLFSGHSGVSIFWSYYYLGTGNLAYKQKSIESLQSSLDSISKIPISHTFCNGISGILWSYCHLVNTKVVASNIDEIIGHDIDVFLAHHTKNSLLEGNYDYLHGGGGVNIYFLERLNNKFILSYLRENIKILYKISKELNDGISWKDWKNESEYNLGLAHGVPSIIILLSRAFEADIERPLVRELLAKSIHWLLKQKKSNKDTCLFPSVLSKDNGIPFSRLSWCYGDLGIAIAILQAGIITTNQEWIIEGINIALHSSTRKEHTETYVNDTCLCHGSSGIALIFNRLYYYTGKNEFRTAAKYWYDQTISFYRFNGHFDMWATKDKGQTNNWERYTGLLEGLAGVGLALLASIYNIEPKWDRCLLLS